MLAECLFFGSRGRVPARVRSHAFSSARNTATRSHGLTQCDAMPVAFTSNIGASNIGAFDTLNAQLRCGLRPAPAQFRPTHCGEIHRLGHREPAPAGGIRLAPAASPRTPSGASPRGNGGTRNGRVWSRQSLAKPSSSQRCRQRQALGLEISARRMMSLVPHHLPQPARSGYLPGVRSHGLMV